MLDLTTAPHSLQRVPRRTRLLIALSMSALLSGCRASTPEPPPSHETHAPEIYGAGLFTTGAWDFFMAFSPDQKRVLFGRADDRFEHYEIHETRLGDDGHWSAPVKPRFASGWSNADPHISPDGQRVFFISNRPHPGESSARATHDIWVAALQADGEWGDAMRLPAPVNDANLDEWSPAVAANGNLYFGAERPGTRGGSDLWVSRLVDGVYQPPENLGDAINTGAAEVEPWIAPDERYLLFSALRRADGVGGYDIYLSRRLPGGGWEKARLLEHGISTPAGDFNQSVTPDGKWLYFSSNRPLAGDVGPRFDHPRNDSALEGIGKGTGDIYRVPMSVLGL